MDLEKSRTRLSEINNELKAIIAKAADDNRELTREEASDIDRLSNDFDLLKADIDRVEKINEQTDLLQTGRGRRSQAEPLTQLEGDGAGDVTVTRTAPREAALNSSNQVPARPIGGNRYSSLTGRGNCGYPTLGHFAADVRRASTRGGHVSRQLANAQEALAAASTYGSEDSGSDGGFAVPPDFRTAIMEAVMGEESLLSRCDQVTVAGNSFTAPMDTTTDWQTSGGIQAFWGTEAGVKTQSKPSLQERTAKLNKVYALVPMTDELVEDAPAMDAYLRRKAPAKIAFKVNLAIVQGDGVGKPLGFLNSPALVSVAKESGQQADTLVANNVIKMYSRMYAPSRNKAVWLINQDIEPQLYKLSLPGTDNTGNAVTGWGGLVYTPANGLSSSPFGTLFGRPVIPTQAMETLGDKGDIAFVDLTQYLALLKGGVNPKVDVSMHLWFDQDMTAFRFVLRVGGMPWWDAAVASRDNANSTYSPYVTLDERA